MLSNASQEMFANMTVKGKKLFMSLPKLLQAVPARSALLTESLRFLLNLRRSISASRSRSRTRNSKKHQEAVNPKP